jgi:DNA-binding MarR family transcriptional regulator
MARVPASSPRPAAHYHSGDYCAEESFGYLMKRVLNSVVQQAEVHLGPHDLTHAQWQPLFKLMKSSAPSMAVAELARELQMDAGAMTRLLDRLEKKNLCRRIRSTEDRRVVMVELTAEGRALAALVPGVLSEVLNAHLAGFSKTEWQALLGYLRRIIDNGEAMRQAQAGGERTADRPTDRGAERPAGPAIAEPDPRG